MSTPTKGGVVKHKAERYGLGEGGGLNTSRNVRTSFMDYSSSKQDIQFHSIFYRNIENGLSKKEQLEKN